ncbi:MAG: hypothetical protein LBO74_16530 [Candidatus Symbiothrix sp.]|jgi:hypothetical protein|nr:hypothetical protein [Candidatus Symbiothrix sp.]
MKKELGKWLIDIAKYIVTAVILSSVFSGVHKGLVYGGGGIVTIITMGWGLYLQKEPPVKNKRKK